MSYLKIKLILDTSLIGVQMYISVDTNIWGCIFINFTNCNYCDFDFFVVKLSTNMASDRCHQLGVTPEAGNVHSSGAPGSTSITRNTLLFKCSLAWYILHMLSFNAIYGLDHQFCR